MAGWGGTGSGEAFYRREVESLQKEDLNASLVVNVLEELATLTLVHYQWHFCTRIDTHINSTVHFDYIYIYIIGIALSLSMYVCTQ